jgi:sulfate adenylyltransferase subunit 2
VKEFISAAISKDKCRPSLDLGLMKTMSNRDLILSKLSFDAWHDAESLARLLEPENLSLVVEAERIASQIFGAVEVLEDIRNGSGEQLNRLVIPSLKSWIETSEAEVFFAEIVLSDILVISGLNGKSKFYRLKIVSAASVGEAIGRLGRECGIVPHGRVHKLLCDARLPEGVFLIDFAHPPTFSIPPRPSGSMKKLPGHLRSLESESIRIIREAVASARKPAMLFSLGKDSMVMLRLAEKAFAPEPVPFPIVNIDTRWKFQDMNLFRDWVKTRNDLDFVHYINPEAVERDINPFDHGSALHTEVTKTRALTRILEENGFDFVFGGARRDEEKSRAKERIFSVRSFDHSWNPRHQRPELWNHFNTVLTNGQTMRVFPLSNWTELDVWRYVEVEELPLVPLYFARIRPVVKRDGGLIMVDDDRFRLSPGENVEFKSVRFRSLGCYPLSGAIESRASSVAQIIDELQTTASSERSSRLIDHDLGSSMEQKKMRGYF